MLSANPPGILNPGTSFSLNATVSPLSGTAIPTGNVVFDIGGDQQSAALNDAGIASYSGTVPATPGPFDISASYQGTASFGVSTSNTLNETVATTLTWSPRTTIIFGDAGNNSVLNASANVAGSVSYLAASSGGSLTAITSTSSLEPGTYTITANFTPTSNLYTAATGNTPLFVSGESVWILGSGGLGELTGGGVALTSSADPGASLAEAIDAVGNVWTIGSSSLLEKTSQVGTLQLSVPSGTGGLSLPSAIAIDGNSQVWVANGNGSVSEFSNAGTALSPPNGFTDSSLSTPSGVAVDLSGSVWITNKGNNSVTRILGGAAPTAPIATAETNKTTGSKP
jgi:hypothetical protein